MLPVTTASTSACTILLYHQTAAAASLTSPSPWADRLVLSGGDRPPRLRLPAEARVALCRDYSATPWPPRPSRYSPLPPARFAAPFADRLAWNGCAACWHPAATSSPGGRVPGRLRPPFDAGLGCPTGPMLQPSSAFHDQGPRDQGPQKPANRWKPQGLEGDDHVISPAPWAFSFLAICILLWHRGSNQANRRRRSCCWHYWGSRRHGLRRCSGCGRSPSTSANGR